MGKSVEQSTSTAERLLQALEKLENASLTHAERFESLLTYAELLYGFGYKETSLRELRFLAGQNPAITSLQKLIENLDPTWIRNASQSATQQKEIIAESEFDITILDD